MDSDLWSTIRRMAEVEKFSISAISQTLRVHRDTVRRALESIAGPPPNKPRGRKRAGKLEPFKTYISQRIEQYPRLFAAKLFLEIKRLGYAGGHTILKDYLQEIRPNTNPSAFLRIETLPGEYAQVDWANIGMIAIGNARRQLSCFVMVLSYSRMMYLEFMLSQCLENFMSAHVNAFHFFNGIPKKINYDNLKTVVLSRVGTDIRFNQRFMDFAGYYLFEPVPCGIRKANEKGKVESGIKYVRSAFLAGREIVSMSRVQQEAQYWRDEEANVRIHGTVKERPIDRFKSEKPLLQALPQADYDCSIIETVHASRQSLVHFQANRYSVPCSHAGKTFTLKATDKQISVYDGTRILTSHGRCYEKYCVIENPRHYDGLLAQRKKARHAKLVESFLNLSEDCRDYLKGLVAAEIHLPGHLEKIQKMVHVYGKSDVVEAIRHASKFNAFGAAYIQNIILQQRAARNLRVPQPITLSKKPQWTKVAVEETDLSLYDELFEDSPGNSDEKA